MTSGYPHTDTGAQAQAPATTRPSQPPEGHALDTRLAWQAIQIRRAIISYAHRYPEVPFHLGGSLSCAEIMAVLFNGIMQTGAGKTGIAWEQRDRFVLSKGHASLALWPALLQAGLLSTADEERGMFGEGAVIGKQPKRDVARGIELSGGSLGMGLGYASGLAWALQRKGCPSRVFCLMGDGETDEGSVWEAASFAGHNHLKALTVVVDANGFQLDGPISQVLSSGPLTDKFDSFGFEVREADGHSTAELLDALQPSHDRPLAVIAHTIKGKGLSFAENDVRWHDRRLFDDGYHRALAELDEAQREVLARGL